MSSAKQPYSSPLQPNWSYSDLLAALRELFVQNLTKDSVEFVIPHSQFLNINALAAIRDSAIAPKISKLTFLPGHQGNYHADLTEEKIINHLCKNAQGKIIITRDKISPSAKELDPSVEEKQPEGEPSVALPRSRSGSFAEGVEAERSKSPSPSQFEGRQ